VRHGRKGTDIQGNASRATERQEWNSKDRIAWEWQSLERQEEVVKSYLFFVTFKKSNEYADAMGELYYTIPKSVLAAIAVSFACRDGDFSDVENELLKEWMILFENGIVQQKPRKPIKRNL